MNDLEFYLSRSGKVKFGLPQVMKISTLVHATYVAYSLVRYEGHGMDLDKAVGECDPKYPIVLLAHQPWAAKQALDSGKYNIRLVLSG